MRPWVVLLWERTSHLYAVIGPFKTKEQAMDYVPVDADEKDMVRQCVPMYLPEMTL